MRVNELRIGNWIENGIGEAFQCNNTTIGEWVLANNTIGQIKPILLTEEWLVKFGFELATGTEGYYWDNELFRIGGMAKWFVPFGIDAFKSIDILYVHQLQNLYFALTGEELTIKE